MEPEYNVGDYAVIVDESLFPSAAGHIGRIIAITEEDYDISDDEAGNQFFMYNLEFLEPVESMEIPGDTFRSAWFLADELERVQKPKPPQTGFSKFIERIDVA